MSIALDNQEFYLKTKAFEKQAYNNAVQQAQALVQKTPSLKARRVVRKLCNEAYANFSQRLHDTFPSQEYQDLTCLTIMSRENLFFLDLKDRLTAIFDEATK